WIDNVNAVGVRLVRNPVVIMVPAVITRQTEAFGEALLQRELEGVVNRIAARDTLGYDAEVGIGHIATIKRCVRIDVVRQVCALRSHVSYPSYQIILQLSFYGQIPTPQFHWLPVCSVRTSCNRSACLG